MPSSAANFGCRTATLRTPSTLRAQTTCSARLDAGQASCLGEQADAVEVERRDRRPFGAAEADVLRLPLRAHRRGATSPRPTSRPVNRRYCSHAASASSVDAVLGEQLAVARDERRARARARTSVGIELHEHVRDVADAGRAADHRPVEEAGAVAGRRRRRRGCRGAGRRARACARPRGTARTMSSARREVDLGDAVERRRGADRRGCRPPSARTSRRRRRRPVPVARATRGRRRRRSAGDSQ